MASEYRNDYDNWRLAGYKDKDNYRYGDNYYWESEAYNNDAMNKATVNPQLTPMQIDAELAQGYGIAPRYTDDWQYYNMRRSVNPDVLVPIDDVADRTLDNGWRRYDRTVRNFFGEPVGAEVYGDWYYDPYADKRISYGSQLQRAYNKMVEAAKSSGKKAINRF